MEGCSSVGVNYRCVGNVVVFIRGLRFTLVSSIIVLSAMLVVDAVAEENVISVMDVTFPCENCYVFPNGECEIEVDGEVRILSTGEAFNKLISYAKDDIEYANALSVLELRNVIFSENLSPEQVYDVLFVLARTAHGSEVIASNGRELISRYHEIVYQAVSNGVFGEAVLLKLWEQVSLGKRDFGRLRTLLAYKVPSVGVNALLSTISADSFEAAFNALIEIYSVLNEVDAKEAEVIYPAVKASLLCRMSSSGDVSQICSKQMLAELPSAVSRVLLRTHAVSLLFAIDDLSDPNEILSRINATDYRQFRNSRAHGALLRLIEFAEKDAEFAKIFLSEKYSDMRKVFSQSDAEIRNRLDGLVKGVSHGGATSWWRSAFSTWMGVVVLAIIIVAVVGFLFVVFLRKRQANFSSRQKFHLEALYSSELGNLLSEFSLPINASAAALKSAYRLRIMDLHPDTGNGDVVELNNLKRKFERAFYLLNGR